MKRLYTFAGIALLLVLLILIRHFEDVLFYDPYLKFFKNDYLYIDSPRRETLKLVLNTSLRYVLNSVISLGVLYLAFKDRDIIRFSILIYGLAYVFLLAAFLYFVVNPRQEDYYLFFNVRRFFIQPLILLVLWPSFFYYRLRQ